MKFKTGKNKRITFGFGPGGIGAEAYRRTVGHYHSGVDYSNGYGSPVYSDNYGIVYKVIHPEDSPSGWCGVYYLVPDDKEGWVEVCQGHLSHVFVKEGDIVRENQMIGLEGNKGTVYSGGVRITKEMQQKGDKRGSHVHEQFRPVRKVKTINPNKHYLNGREKHKYTDAKGLYKDRQGYYYEIKYTNEMRGCIDPHTYLYQPKALPVELVDKWLCRLRIIR